MFYFNSAFPDKFRTNLPTAPKKFSRVFIEATLTLSFWRNWHHNSEPSDTWTWIYSFRFLSLVFWRFQHVDLTCILYKVGSRDPTTWAITNYSSGWTLAGICYWEWNLDSNSDSSIWDACVLTSILSVRPNAWPLSKYLMILVLLCEWHIFIPVSCITKLENGRSSKVHWNTVLVFLLAWQTVIPYQL